LELVCCQTRVHENSLQVIAQPFHGAAVDGGREAALVVLQRVVHGFSRWCAHKVSHDGDYLLCDTKITALRQFVKKKVRENRVPLAFFRRERKKETFFSLFFHGKDFFSTFDTLNIYENITHYEN
jgi:hypothetical protein